MANSYVGCQTLISEDRVQGACVWEHSLTELSYLSTQGSAEQDDTQSAIIDHTDDEQSSIT